MIEFIRSVFRGLFSIAIVICIIAVVVFGLTVFDDSFLIGILIILGGLIVVIVSAGFIATILNIDENLEKIVKNIPIANRNHIQEDSSLPESENDDKEQYTPPRPLSNNQVNIVRWNSSAWFLLPLDVKLDNQKFQLENGEEKIINVENGRHTISAYFNNDDEKLEFDIDNNSKTIIINIGPPIKIQLI